MNSAQRVALSEMISANNVTDQTPLIRELKHSAQLRTEIAKLLEIKARYEAEGNTDRDALNMEGMIECNLLSMGYTDLYNKIRTDDVDLSVLNKMLDVLQSIEEGKVDQHMASFEIGQVLKTLYVDSALKRAKKITDTTPEVSEYRGESEDISWNTWKRRIRTDEPTTCIASPFSGHDIHGTARPN